MHKAHQNCGMVYFLCRIVFILPSFSRFLYRSLYLLYHYFHSFFTVLCYVNTGLKLLLVEAGEAAVGRIICRVGGGIVGLKLAYACAHGLYGNGFKGVAAHKFGEAGAFKYTVNGLSRGFKERKFACCGCVIGAFCQFVAVGIIPFVCIGLLGRKVYFRPVEHYIQRLLRCIGKHVYVCNGQRGEAELVACKVSRAYFVV